MSPSLPRISMSLSARYTTQSSAYDRLLHGPVLTDRRIEELRRSGAYGVDARLKQLGADMERQVARKRTGKRHLTVGQLLSKYGI